MAGQKEEKESTKEGRKLPQFVAAFTATLIALSMGMSASWTSPVLAILQGEYGEPRLTPEEGSWVGSLLTVGAFFGCFPAGKIADILGRRRFLLILAFPVTLSWGLLMFGNTVWYLYVGRFIGGFTFGVVSVVAPTYISDLAEPSVRGTLGAFFQLQIVTGLMLMYFVGLINNVFIMTLICSTVPFLFVVCFVWMPESPVFLVRKGRQSEALSSLTWLRGPSYDARSELSRIVEELSTAESAGFLDVFTSPVFRKGIFMTFFLMFLQQGSGINAVVFYTNHIFKLSGSDLEPAAASAILGVITATSTLAGMVVIDRFGRKTMLASSCGLSGLSLVGISLYMILRPQGMAWLPILCMCLYSLGFSLGLGGIPWIMMGELFPGHMKGPTGTLTASVSWGLAFVVTKFFQDWVDMIGIGYTFLIFAFICFVGVAFSLFVLPETKGKTFQEILVELGEKPKPSVAVIDKDEEAL